MWYINTGRSTFNSNHILYTKLKPSRFQLLKCKNRKQNLTEKRNIKGHNNDQFGKTDFKINERHN